METNGIKYIRHYYQVKPEKFKSGIYTLVNNSIHNYLLPEQIKVEIIGSLANSKEINIYFSPRNLENFSELKPCELKITTKEKVYEGYLINPDFDRPTPQSMVLAQFGEQGSLLVIDVFKDFYTYNPFAFSLILENHNYQLSKKASY